MANGRTKNASLNTIFALLLQLVTLFRGLILPRIIIPAYGSDLNGLIASITQVLGYISLLEAGVGSIFRTSLYKPLANGDMDGVSGIINEQKRFYRKIGFIFIFYVLVVCGVYPFIAKTDIEPFYIITLILILSVSTFAEYFVSLPYASLISADQKIRINYIVNIFFSLVHIFVALFWVSMHADIRLIYVSTCIIGLLRPLFYYLYVKKHYSLSKNAKPDKTSMNQRWSGMAHHFAYYIHTNTDSVILTVFLGTAMVSVYNVYSAVILGIEKVITSVSTGISAGLGNLLASDDKERIRKTVDMFEFFQGALTTVCFTITALMLIPFIRLYTVTMTDIDYIHPSFGYLLIIAEAIYCFRCIYSTVSTNANKYKETQLGAILECATNLAVSLILVSVAGMGLLGVAIGTVVGMFTRYIFDVVFLSKNVIFRSVLKAVKMSITSICVAGASLALCNLVLDYSCVNTVQSWLVYAVITSIMVAVIASVVYLIFYFDVIKSLIKKLLRRG